MTFAILASFLWGNLNAKKTKCMVFNIEEPTEIYTKDGSKLDIVKDFRYLGSQTQSSEADIKSRKASAWKACNKLTKIWKSPLSQAFKICLFQAVVESVLMYGSETWTPTRALVIQLDVCKIYVMIYDRAKFECGKWRATFTATTCGVSLTVACHFWQCRFSGSYIWMQIGCYTWLLRTVLKVDWRDHVTNEDLYGDLPRLSTKLQRKRLKLPATASEQKTKLCPGRFSGLQLMAESPEIDHLKPMWTC